MIAKESKGFLYVVSSLGVTGTRKEITTDFETLLAPLKGNSPVPYCIGFGISNPEQAKKMAQFCDGVIVGSAFVNRVAQNGTNAAEEVGKFAGVLKAQLKSV